MSNENEWKHLGPRQGSNYRQFFVKGRRIRAETLYRETVGEEPSTPEEVARDYDVPLEAVLEAIDYSIKNEDLLNQELDEDWADIRARGLDKPPYVPADYQPDQ
jgi:uncharacterized protein (DUF433 family)